MTGISRLLSLIVFVLMIASCTVVPECSQVVDNAKTCSGTIATLDGNGTLTYNVQDLGVTRSVQVEVNISVVSGRVDVSFPTADGRTVRAQAVIGKPVTKLRGTLLLDANRNAVITLRSNGGTATEVGYTVRLSS